MQLIIRDLIYRSPLNRIKDIQPSISEKKFFATIDRYIKLIKDKEID